MAMGFAVALSARQVLYGCAGIRDDEMTVLRTRNATTRQNDVINLLRVSHNCEYARSVLDCATGKKIFCSLTG